MSQTANRVVKSCLDELISVRSVAWLYHLPASEVLERPPLAQQVLQITGLNLLARASVTAVRDVEHSRVGVRRAHQARRAVAAWSL